MTADRFFVRRGDELHCEDLALRAIADAVGTPCYVYSRAAIEYAWRELDSGFGSHPHTICYAVKANSNLAVLDILARLGAGFDIVSGGELERVLAPGGHWLMYGFFNPDPASNAPGLIEADLELVPASMTLVWRQDGFDKRERPSAWFLYRKSR